MGLVDQLWDETVAGPLPEFGLSRLRNRKYASFSSFSSSTTAADAVPAVTRSITIVRPPSLSVPPQRGESSSVPSSPLEPATTPSGDGWRKLHQKSKMAGVRAEAAVGPRSPTVYDWVVISSLDR